MQSFFKHLCVAGYNKISFPTAFVDFSVLQNSHSKYWKFGLITALVKCQRTFSPSRSDCMFQSCIFMHVKMKPRYKASFLGLCFLLEDILVCRVLVFRPICFLFFFFFFQEAPSRTELYCQVHLVDRL